MESSLLHRTQAIVVGSVFTLIAFGLFLSGATQLLALYSALLLCGVVGILLYRLLPQENIAGLPKAVSQLVRIAAEPEFSEIQDSFADSLSESAQHKDPIFRNLAKQRLQHMLKEAELLAAGTIEFQSTESWRATYEELLRSPGLHFYRSVSLIESENYWREGPGQQSTKLNLELQDERKVRIERIAIIADHLWPVDTLFPLPAIHGWLEEQHRHGIWLRLIRESEIAQEPELLCDFGIYGYRAVGRQTADPEGNTIRFSLCFDFDRLKEAEHLWDRLKLFGVSYRELLDRQH